MKRKLLCVAILACLAAGLVQSESTVEVDENGDEYDVKRFHIQGRQLDGRSQCVVSRRKRSSATPAEESFALGTGYADEAQNSQEADNARKSSVASTSETTPPNTDGFVSSEGSADGDNDKEDGDDISGDGNSDEGEEIQADHGAGNGNGALGGAIEDYDYETAEENEDALFPLDAKGQSVQVSKSKNKNKNKNKNKKKPQAHLTVQTSNHGVAGASAAASVSGGPAVMQVASLGAAAEDGQGAAINGVAILHSNMPPQVDSDTHALFQLVPVNNAVNAAIDYDADGGHLVYNEEINPVSTTAIWSTGANEPDDLYDDYDQAAVISKPSKKKKRPTNSKAPKRPTKSKKKKTKKSKPKRRRPGNRNKRPVPARKGGSQNGVRRRRPTIRQGVKGSSNSNKRRNTHNRVHSANSNRRLNSNIKNRNVKRKNNKKQDLKDRGTRTFTKTETMTATGTPNDEKDVNCIIIRKDPPPTQRPFPFNLLGRSANGGGVPRASGRYGNRKRASLFS